ncbi:transposase [Ancylobacter oerskovii]|uniref:Transposase n=1 Tax=Ancylobacter oerskovii TaxID=459519 RepID=A0ABW4Z573_9HYPH
MAIPGVGPVTSRAFVSTIDVPARFKTSKAVGPSLGLTPVLHQSGESYRIGRISRRPPRESDCSVSFYGSHAGRATRLIPKRKADPREAVGKEHLNALDPSRPNREEPKFHAETHNKPRSRS